MFTDPSLPKPLHPVTAIIPMLFDFILIIALAVIPFVLLFITNPQLDSVLFILYDRNPPILPKWVNLFAQILLYGPVVITVLHFLTPVYLMGVYGDLTTRSLQYSKKLMENFPITHLKYKHRPWVRNFTNRRLQKVLALFIEQKLLNSISETYFRELMPFYMVFLQPSAVPAIYMSVRFYDLFPIIIYLPTVACTLTLLYILVLVHTVASSPFELSIKILRMRKTVIPFWNLDPYWRTRFRSLTPIRWRVLWFTFEMGNLLPLMEKLVNATTSVLIL